MLILLRFPGHFYRMLLVCAGVDGALELQKLPGTRRPGCDCVTITGTRPPFVLWKGEDR